MSSPATLESILTQRRQATQTPVNVDEAGIELVIFQIQTRHYALRGPMVREILAEATVYPVPGAPASMEGIINVHGDVESVITLHELLRLPEPATPTRQSRILISRGTAMTSGIRVDAVLDVTTLPLSALQPAPEGLPETLRPYIQHLFHYAQTPVMLLDLDRLFADYAQGLAP